MSALNAGSGGLAGKTFTFTDNTDDPAASCGSWRNIIGNWAEGLAVSNHKLPAPRNANMRNLFASSGPSNVRKDFPMISWMARRVSAKAPLNRLCKSSMPLFSTLSRLSSNSPREKTCATLLHLYGPRANSNYPTQQRLVATHGGEAPAPH